MFKRIFLMAGLAWMLTAGMPLMAQEGDWTNPRIVLGPTTFQVGELATSGTYLETIVINNLGRSLLYISKIKFT
jgi:hypothetical protein